MSTAREHMADDLALVLADQGEAAVIKLFNGLPVSLVWEPLGYEQGQPEGVNIERCRLYLAESLVTDLVPGQMVPFDGGEWLVGPMDRLDGMVEMELSRNLS